MKKSKKSSVSTKVKGSKVHTNEKFTAVTVPADGFERLISFENHENGKVWIHKNFVK